MPLSFYVVFPAACSWIILDRESSHGLSMLGVFGTFLLSSLIHNASKPPFYYHDLGSQDQISQTPLEQRKPNTIVEIGAKIIQLSILIP